jgi:PKD repeat protein
VRVESVEGPAATVVEAKSGIRAINMADPAAVLAGLTVSNANLSGTQHGVGIQMVGGVVSNCVVVKCTANRGSMLSANGGLITHSVIRNNTEAGNSGGIGGVNLLGGAVLQHSTVAGNRAGSEDNGIAGIKTAGGSTVRYCVIERHPRYSATKVNDAVRMTGAGDVLRNCLIVNNDTRGVHMSAGGTIESCTISSNSVYGGVGNGVQMTHASGVLRNSIVWGNGDNTANLNATAGTVEYTDVNPPSGGTGNQSSDPTFVAYPADFRLSPGSPVIDNGATQAWMAAATDLDGSNRVIAASVDMGAYEAPDASAGPLSVNFDAPLTEGFTNFTVVFTASPVGSDTNIVFYGWDFGDGQTIAGGSEKIVVTNVYTQPGFYDVTLVATNASNQGADKLKEAFVYAVPHAIYVATNGSHASPFDTLAKASTNMADALAITRVIGPESTEMRVDSGTHRITAQLGINKGITVRSLNGPETTIVSRQPAGNFRIFELSDADAVVDGFTITNGVAPGENMGGGVQMSAGLLKNCIVTHNTGFRSAGGVWMSGGVVSNCLVRNNRDNSNSGNTGGVKMQGGLMIDCVLTGNNGGNEAGGSVGGLRMAGGEARNCVITNNIDGAGSGRLAGGASVGGSGRLRTCLVFGNEGVGIQVGGGEVVNCNALRNSGYGVVYASGTVTNSIVIFNNSGSGDISGSTAAFGHCCSPDVVHDPLGTGNITSDPAFKGDGSGYGAGAVPGDYHLDNDSPCINRGAVESWMASATDLDGAPRVVDGVPEIGVYEYASPPGTVILIR